MFLFSLWLTQNPTTILNESLVTWWMFRRISFNLLKPTIFSYYVPKNVLSDPYPLICYYNTLLVKYVCLVPNGRETIHSTHELSLWNHRASRTTFNTKSFIFQKHREDLTSAN